MNWIEQGLAGQGRVGHDQTELGRAKHGFVVLGRSGHGCLGWLEVIRTEQGSAGLGSLGQNWAGLLGLGRVG